MSKLLATDINGGIRLLIAEKDPLLLEKAASELRQLEWDVLVTSDGDQACRLLETHAVLDLVLADIDMPGSDGIEILKRSRAVEDSTPVVLTAPPERLGRALRAMRLGALDYIQKPFSIEALPMKLQRAIEHGRLLRAVRSHHLETKLLSFEDLAAESGVMREIGEAIPALSASDVRVIVFGEPGTGKRMVAEAIHAHSARAANAFVAVACLGDDSALERILFRREVQGETGGDGSRPSLVELAHGGTLFLDEIGNLGPRVRERILRLLEDRVFERADDGRTIRVDIRLIAAASSPLENSSTQGVFRDVLSHQLSVLHVGIPPLRERPEEIVPIAQRIVDRCAGKLDKPVRGFTPAAAQALRSYAWPGNIRELQRAIEQAVLLAEHEEIEASDLAFIARERRAPLAQGGSGMAHIPTRNTSEDFDLESLERHAILEALRLHDWIQKDAARALRISPRAMNYKIQKHKIAHARWRKNKLPA